MSRWPICATACLLSDMKLNGGKAMKCMPPSTALMGVAGNAPVTAWTIFKTPWWAQPVNTPKPSGS